MRLILDWFVNPFTLFLAVSLLSIFFFILKKPRQFKVSAFLAALWLFLISVSPLPQFLIYRLERQYPVFSVDDVDLERSVHIIILGAGHSYDTSLQTPNRLGNAGLARLIEAWRISSLIPSAKIIASGNSASGRLPQAFTVGQSAVELGYPASDTILLPSPGTTSEEAFSYVKRFGTDNQLVLVTSASHMPRAVAYFSRYGVIPIPAPTHHYLKIDPAEFIFDFKPSLTKIEMTMTVLHEYAGWVKFYIVS